MGRSHEVRNGGHAGRTIALKVRLADFRTVNRSRTLNSSTDVAREIFSTAWSLFEVLGTTEHIRLLGVRVEGLSPGATASRQPVLGEPERGRREERDRCGRRGGPVRVLHRRSGQPFGTK